MYKNPLPIRRHKFESERRQNRVSFFYKPYKFIQHILQNQHGNNYRFIAQAIKNFNHIFHQLIDTRNVFCKERALRFAPLSALMTVETALALPFFLIAIFTILNIMHMLGVGQSILTAAAKSVHISSVHGYKDNFGVDDILTEIILNIGKSDVDFSKISGGMAGIDYWGTSYDDDSGKIKAQLSCFLKSDFGVFDIGMVRWSLQLHSRAFIGGKMLDGGSSEEKTEKTVVYVAQNGVVYHRSRECAYIDLSLHGIDRSAIGDCRNSQGGKYYPCELCGAAGDFAVVYLTDTGNRYHCSSQCPGISRTVYEMILTPDCVLPPCSRCG